jgi:hypothetical protein
MRSTTSEVVDAARQQASSIQLIAVSDYPRLKRTVKTDPV